MRTYYDNCDIVHRTHECEQQLFNAVFASHLKRHVRPISHYSSSIIEDDVAPLWGPRTLGFVIRESSHCENHSARSSRPPPRLSHLNNFFSSPVARVALYYREINPIFDGFGTRSRLFSIFYTNRLSYLLQVNTYSKKVDISLTLYPHLGYSIKWSLYCTYH